jgi:hypothetical protein
MLGGEITCEPACPGVDAQARLHAGKVIAGRLKDLQGCAQLVSLRPILGVVDHRECSARKRKGDIERLWFCRRADGRNGDHRNGDTMFARSDCRAGGIIFRFDCDDYVKFFQRIV